MSDDAPNLFEQQELNRRRSRHLILLFVWLFGWLGFSGDFVLREATRDGRFLGYQYFFPWMTTFMLVVGVGVTLYAWFSGPRRVLWAIGARPLTVPESSDDKQLLDVVEEMAIAAGLPCPRVYVVADTDPNAFATGRDERDACIVVTEGMLRVCSRDELQAVIAHEMGHVKNLDVRLTTLLAALVGAVALMSSGLWRLMFGVGTNRKTRQEEVEGEGLGVLIGVGFIVWIVTWLLAPLASRLIALGVSRDREFLADAMSAQFTRNPAALAKALHKIDAADEPTTSFKGGVAHLCICDPLGRPENAKHGFWADLLATHPPMEERIAALRAMAYESEPAAARSETMPVADPA